MMFAPVIAGGANSTLAGADHDLTAQDIATSAPSVASPSITQVHGLTAQDVATSAPVIEQPSVTSGADHSLKAQNVATAAAVIEQAAIVEPVELTAQNIVTGVPQIDGAVLTINKPVTVRAYKRESQYRTAPVFVIDSKRPLVVYRVVVENDALSVEEVSL